MSDVAGAPSGAKKAPQAGDVEGAVVPESDGVGRVCPDCGCQENGWNARRMEFMAPWSQCCGYPDRAKHNEERAVKLHDVLEVLYRSEINVSVSCFWDGGWDVKLGDEMNGFKSEGNFSSISNAAKWLHAEALRHFPESQYAKEMRHAGI